MRNIKKLIVVVLIVMNWKMSGMGNNTDGFPEQFHNCLIAFTYESNFENSLTYKTGPDEEISFGIVTQEQFENVKLLNPQTENSYYFLRLLVRAKMRSNTPNTVINRFRQLPVPKRVAKVTPQERELIKKAIRHNGARFWGYPTDGDSLQLWESSK